MPVAVTRSPCHMTFVATIRAAFDLGDRKMDSVLGKSLVPYLSGRLQRHLVMAGHAVLLDQVEPADAVVMTLLAPLAVLVADRAIAGLLGVIFIADMTPKPIGWMGHGGLVAAFARE